MRLTIPVLAATLAGCAPSFLLDAQTCDEDFLGWHGGLTRHILQGPGDGSFDYDPEGLAEARIAGAYDLATGDFDYEVSYDPSHWRSGTSIAGYGYAKTNGDLDIEYTTFTTDIRARTFSAEVRERRTGCDVVRRTTYGEEEEWHFGTYAPDRYTYRDESIYNGEPWIVTGTLFSDLSYTDRLQYASTSLTYTYTEEGDADGYSRRVFTQVSSGSRFEGYIERFLDGSEHVFYTGVSTGTWDYTLDYDGDGTGTYSEGGATCTLTFTGGNCRYDCSGSTGQC